MSGFLDSFLFSVGMGGSGGETIVRVDRVALYEGSTELWDSPMLERQDYSTDGPMVYAVTGGHAENIADVSLKVMNENFSQEPFFGMDTIRLDWRYGSGAFRLQRVVQSPPDYPILSP